MAGSDDTATFAVDLKADGTKGPAEAAAGALEKLKSKIQDDVAALSEMQKALRNLKGGGAVATAQFTELKDKIEGQKATIAQNQAKYIDLGGTFKKLKPAADEAGSGLDAVLKRAQGSSGPLGQYAGKLSEIAEIFGGGLSAGVIAVAVSMVAMTIAVIAATAALTGYGLAQANAHRAELLTLEGLTKVRNYYGLAAGSASEMQDAITKVSASSALGRDRIAQYAEQLYRTGLRGQNLTDALEGVATVASVQGEAMASMFEGQAASAARSGVAVRRLADDVKARLGGIASAQLLDLNVQSQKLHESFSALFAGLHIEGALEGLKSVTDLFSQNSETGKALKLLVETMFQPLIDQIDTGGPLVKRFFQGMVLAALDVAIAVQKTRLWFKQTFGASDILSGMASTSNAILVGKIALYSFIAALGIVAVATAIMMAPFILGVAGIGVFVAALVGAYNWLKGLSWTDIGSGLIDGFFNGINAGISKVVGAIKNLGHAALEALRVALDSHSPSRLGDKIGFTIPQGVAQGQDRGRGLVRASAMALGNSAVAGLGASMDLKPGAPAAHGGNTRGGSSFTVRIGELHFHGDSEPKERAESTKDELLRIFQEVAASFGASLEPEPSTS